MLKMVGFGSYGCDSTDADRTGQPKSELKKAGQPPRILSPEEQDKMRTVCRVCVKSTVIKGLHGYLLSIKLGREVLDLAASHIRPGVTTDEIDEVVHNACIERNSYPSPLNYRGFPKSVCT